MLAGRWSTLRAWWSTHRRRFGLTVAITCAVLLAAAIASGLDAVMHAAGQALAAAVWLPIALAAGLMLLVILPFLPFVLLGALLGESGDVGSETAEHVGGKVVGGYFGWVFRQRSPVFWGIPVGTVAALAILATVASVRAAPDRAARAAEVAERERTAQILARAQTRLAQLHAETGRLPEPAPGDRLLGSALDPDGPDGADQPLVAGGAPLVYRVVETRSTSSYTLTAAGGACVDGLFRHKASKRALVRLGKRVLHGREAEPVRCPAR
jgi:hypothetical protein